MSTEPLNATGISPGITASALPNPRGEVIGTINPAQES